MLLKGLGKKSNKILKIMKIRKHVFFVCLVSSFTYLSCSSGDKYLGTWSNTNSGAQMTISKHKQGTLFTDIGNQSVYYDINYAGQLFYAGINGRGELGIFDNLTMQYFNSTLKYEDGHLKGLTGWLVSEGEWEKKPASSAVTDKKLEAKYSAFVGG